MVGTPGRSLSPLKEADGSVVGAVLSHMMYASTVEIPTPPPIPWFLPVPLPPLPFPPIPTPCTPLT